MINQYNDPNKNGTGKQGRRYLQGNSHGPYVVPVPFVVKESFDESDLTGGEYPLTETYGDNIGFGIYNNNTANTLTFTIGTISIPVPPEKSFYGVFETEDTITVTGTGLDFDAFVEG